MERIQFAVFGSFLLIAHSIWSQQPVTLSIFNESTAVPYNDLVHTPVHPGVQIGTEFNWKENRHFRLYPSISIGYMFHRKLFQGLFANLELGLDYKTSFGLNLKSKIGLGYLHTFSTQQEFQFEGGKYRSSSEIFVLYQSWLEYPYSPGFIPLMAHTNLHLGFKFYPL